MACWGECLWLWVTRTQVDPDVGPAMLPTSPARHHTRSSRLLSELRSDTAHQLVGTPQKDCDIATVQKRVTSKDSVGQRGNVSDRNEARRKGRKAGRWPGHMSALRGRAGLWPEPILTPVLRAEALPGERQQ